MSTKVSFTVRRPSPVSRAPSSGGDSDASSGFKVPSLPRHLRNPNESTPGSPLARSGSNSPSPADSSDEEDDELQDELVTGFDRFGVQRVTKKKQKEGPLVIPALKNKDWREVARKRRGQDIYVPPSAAAQTGADGSVGGLGTRDSINSGPMLSGLQFRKQTAATHAVTPDSPNGEESSDEDVTMGKPEPEEDSEDKIALRALLAEAGGTATEGSVISIIAPPPVSESDALKQDIDELPDVASLEDYERVPVSQFGAALLRGMGWKEGTAATRKPGKGIVEPYLPAARPALLGIGAKEMEVFDDGSGKKKSSKRPDKRYVPVVKLEKESNGNGDRGRDHDRDRERRERSRSRSPRRGDRSGTVSRRSSRSPDRKRDGEDRRRNGDKRDYDSSRDRDRDRDRERDYDSSKSRKRESDRDRDRERDRRRDRSPDSSKRKRDRY
ncbi:hypothetical protein BDN72DRAFT_664676 [Pluteus cervinus]|uniref:Uncharacterized protein n=1 Tax=Pluteus cervinus TaxID=181527 RepID=A0ACD3B8Y2_9AGAR|nr:hypothetical protein BDN72DRAFT_664676 [Pluteus cervinus]